MNFFEQQDRAKRNTTRLIILLVIAVISLVTVTTLFLAGAYHFFGFNNTAPIHPQTSSGSWPDFLQAISPNMLLLTTLGISAVVILGGLFRHVQLRGGGRTVAEAMGGKLLQGTTQDPDERKILNIVEEMAIASGTSVPPVYLLDEMGINAFAAGYHPQDAVIGITRGCIQLLNRDELQGVVAHEFSHIFHGDMRINMRLIALLHGILLLGLIGKFLIHSANHRHMLRSRKNNAIGAILGIGIGLYIIGYSGTFFGNLIRAAVSRQREFLADASAVQFTRNPDGIAGALKKIGAHSAGATLQHSHTTEYSHMFFGQAISHFIGWMATHPPLAERIKRIQPRWDGHYPQQHTSIHRSDTGTNTQVADSASAFVAPAHSDTDLSAQHTYPVDIDKTLKDIAQPTQVHLDYAKNCLSRIPPPLKAAAREPFGARGVVLGLLLDKQAVLRTHQLTLLQQQLTAADFQALHPLMLASADTEDALRLPLLELTLPALKQLSPEQLAQFLQQLEYLVRADNKVSLSEWALYRIVRHNTQPGRSIPFERHTNLKAHLPQAQQLLSLLAYAGSPTEPQAIQAFARARTSLDAPSLHLIPRSHLKLSDIDNAITALSHVKPLQKPQLLKAMSECVLHDGTITLTEAELYRAIADSLDCPIPPMITQLMP